MSETNREFRKRILTHVIDETRKTGRPQLIGMFVEIGDILRKHFPDESSTNPEGTKQ